MKKVLWGLGVILLLLLGSVIFTPVYFAQYGIWFLNGFLPQVNAAIFPVSYLYFPVFSGIFSLLLVSLLYYLPFGKQSMKKVLRLHLWLFPLIIGMLIVANYCISLFLLAMWNSEAFLAFDGLLIFGPHYWYAIPTGTVLSSILLVAQLITNRKALLASYKQWRIQNRKEEPVIICEHLRGCVRKKGRAKKRWWLVGLLLLVLFGSVPLSKTFNSWNYIWFLSFLPEYWMGREFPRDGAVHVAILSGVLSLLAVVFLYYMPFDLGHIKRVLRQHLWVVPVVYCSLASFNYLKYAFESLDDPNAIPFVMARFWYSIPIGIALSVLLLGLKFYRKRKGEKLPQGKLETV